MLNMRCAKDLEKVKVIVVVSGGGHCDKNHYIINYREMLAKNRQYWQMAVNSTLS